MGPPNLWVTVWPNTLHQWRIAQGGTMPHPPKHGTGLNTPTFEPRVGLTGQDHDHEDSKSDLDTGICQNSSIISQFSRL